MSNGNVTSVVLELANVYSKLSKYEEQSRKAGLESILADTEQFVPSDTGELRGSGRVIENGIEYTAPYAMAVYYGESRNFTTPGTTSHWFEASKSMNMHKWTVDMKGAMK